jgi:urease accessory protein
MTTTNLSTKRLLRCLAGAAALAAALPASAHPGHGASGFLAGLAHPFTGLDHLLALLAVGLVSRQQDKGYVLPPVFLVMAALGASSAAIGIAGGALELSIAATVVLLGALAACGLRLAPALSMLLVSGCAFVHGLAHGRELAGMASGAGFLLTSAVLMALGALPDARLRRAAGVAIGVAGVLLMAA